MAAFVLANILLSAYFIDTRRTPNPTSRALPVLSLFESGTWNIDKYAGYTQDKSYVRGHYYSEKAPLPALAVVPFYGFLKILGVAGYKLGTRDPLTLILGLGSFLCGSLPFVGILTLTFLAIRDRSASLPSVVLTCFAFYGSFIFCYSGTYYGHVMAGAFLLSAYILLKGRTNYASAGLLVGLGFLSDYLTGLAVPIWSLQIFLNERDLKKVSRFILGFLPAATFILLYNLRITGSPFTMVYQFVSDNAFSEMRVHLGFRGPHPEALWELLFSPSRSLFVYAPILACAAFAWLRSVVQEGAPFWPKKDYIGLLSVSYWLVVSSYYTWWGGWTYGPRLLIPIAILLMYEAVRYVSQNRSSKTLFYVLSGYGLLSAWLDQSTVGHFVPDNYAWPVFQVFLSQFLKRQYNQRNILSMSLDLDPAIAVMLWIILFAAITTGLAVWHARPSRPEQMAEKPAARKTPRDHRPVWLKNEKLRRHLREIAGNKFLKNGLFPCLLYFIGFCALTFPAIRFFSTHFFADTGDGLLNIWNIWWVNKAVTQLHQSPWYTSYLYAPLGVHLLGHTLVLFNNLCAIGLLKIFTLRQTYNVLVIFSYVAAGLTAFLLAYDVTKAYSGSLVAGFIFTFSNYHFAHTNGHLNLVSLEWIPLFVLSWRKFMLQPSPWKALAAALALWLVILCDYYYFFYCVLMIGLMSAGYAYFDKDVIVRFWKNGKIPLLLFVTTCLLTSGLLVTAFLRENYLDPLIGSHPASVFSLDALALFIPGGHWRFAELTRPYWSYLPGNIEESSVYLGFSVIGLLLATWFRRHRAANRGLTMWYAIALFFAVMALGPVLHIAGREFPGIPLPYLWLVKIFPALSLSGCPVRMVVMTVLCASIPCAAGFNHLLSSRKMGRWIVLPWLILLFVEYLPSPMVLSQPAVRTFALVLGTLPGTECVLDDVSGPFFSMYNQIFHEKPMAGGTLSRCPQSRLSWNGEVNRLLRQRKYQLLYRIHHIRYLATRDDPALVNNPHLKLIYRDRDNALYDMKEEGT